ncbi:hypothetical protein B0H14DRAFT_2626040 [Mycena olivaceomarginata]|nr:hypothetical protein B0H14DRAFT_2626040 [Mycena olivaceomarginata]
MWEQGYETCMRYAGGLMRYEKIEEHTCIWSPPEWTTIAQKEYLQKQLPIFLSAIEKKGTSLACFWGTLKVGWFELWPTETTLGVPLPPAAGEEDIRTEAQLLAVGEATKIRQKRLKNWMYNQCHTLCAAGPSLGLVVSTGGKGRGKRWSLFSQLKRKKSMRPYRKIEIYQRLYGAKLKEEANKHGYGLLNAEAAAEGIVVAEARVMSEAEAVVAELAETEATEARLKEYRRQQMSLQQTVAMEMFTGETAEVLAEVNQETAACNEEHTAVASEDSDKHTPEDMQLAIDELGEVVKMVLESMAVATGWQFMLVGGGPLLRNGGNIQAKTICFGTTAHGTDFRGSHPNFDKAVLTPFIKYLKHVFPHKIRDARVHAADNDENKEGEDDPLAGLLLMDELPAPPPKATKPKHMWRTKPPAKRAAAILPPAALASGAAASAAAAPAPGPPVVPPPVPPAVPTEIGYRTPTLSRPQATPGLIPVPDDFDETMQAINYHFDNTARPPPPPLDLDLNSDLNSDLNDNASSTFGFQSAHAWSDDEDLGAFTFGRTSDYPCGGQIRKSGQDFAGVPPAKVKVRTRLGLCFESLGLGVRTGQRGVRQSQTRVRTRFTRVAWVQTMILPKPKAATRLKSSMSDYLSIVDDTDLQKDNPQWKPSEWINTRSYKRRRKDWFLRLPR